MTKINVFFFFTFVSFVSSTPAFGYDLPAVNGVNKVESSIVINAPIEKVWEFNSHDEYAKNWSVFFAKIVPCPLAECPQNKNLKPSDIGYVRRPYRNENEKGIYWDEETLAVIKTSNKIIKYIRSYNFHGYFWYRNGEQFVEQIYEKLEDNKTRMSFKSQLYDRDKLKARTGRVQYTVWRSVGHFVKKVTKKSFNKNLVNIKAAIEDGDKYVRVHPYE